MEQTVIVVGMYHLVLRVYVINLAIGYYTFSREQLLFTGLFSCALISWKPVSNKLPLRYIFCPIRNFRSYSKLSFNVGCNFTNSIC